MRQRLQRINRGPGPQVLLVVGEPGIGKSRLLAEATAQLDVGPVRRLVGFEPERDVPLAAAAGLFAQLGSAGEPGRRLSAMLRADDSGALEFVRVLEAASRALLSLGPVLLVIDDLQWLDSLSRAFAHHVVRAAYGEGAPLAMLCATRPAPESAAFAASLRKVVPEASFEQFTLEPIDCAAGAALARAIDPSLTPARAEEIWRTGRGSPFWIEVNAMTGSNADESVALLPAMLRALSSDAATCLSAVVLLGRPGRQEDVAAVLEWPASRVSAAAAELVRRGLVSLRASLVETAHDLVREAAALEIPGSEAQRLHARIADHLRQQAAGDLQLLMEALEHAAAAGIATAPIALEVAQSPQRRLLGAAGYERLAAAAETPVLDPTAHLELRRRLAELAEEVGSSQAAYDHLTWLADALPAPRDRGAAALGAARLALALGRSREVSAALEVVRRCAGDDAWTLVAADALDYSRLVWLDHDAASAAVHLELASGTARGLVAVAGGIEELVGAARDAFVQVLDAERVDRLMADDIDGVIRLSHALVDATRGLGERHLDARLNAALMTRFLDRWPEVVTSLAAVLREAQQQVYPAVAADAALELALATYSVGRVHDARECHERARQLARRIDRLREEVADTWVCGLRQLIDASAVDWRAAVASLLQEAAAQDNPHCRLLLHQRAAMLAARFDPSDSRQLVRDELAAANADAAVADCVRCLAEVQIVTVELMARIGDVERAEAHLSEWEAGHAEPNPRIAFFRDRAAALLAVGTGRADGIARLKALAAAAAAAGTQLDRVWALLDLGAALSPDDRAAAVEPWTEARELAADLGAASERAVAERELRTVGVRSAPSPRSRPFSGPIGALSRRECEVARLAVDGARTAEIAASLFISPKTVEQHLSHVFSKLAVRNRAELGARFGSDLHLSEAAAVRG